MSFLDNDFNLIMVASTTETSFNKISFNQKNFHVLSFIYRLKLKQFENLNGIKNSFKLTKFLFYVRNKYGLETSKGASEYLRLLKKLNKCKQAINFINKCRSNEVLTLI